MILSQNQTFILWMNIHQEQSRQAPLEFSNVFSCFYGKKTIDILWSIMVILKRITMI